MNPDNSDIRTISIMHAVRRRPWLIVALAVLGVTVGWWAGQQTSLKYTATTQILLNPLEGNPFYPSSRGEQLINLATESQALRSNHVAEAAAEWADVEKPPADFLSKVKVSIPVNTQILEVNYTSTHKENALLYSQAFAESFLEYRAERATTRMNEQTSKLGDQITEIDQQLDELALQRSAVVVDPVQTSVIDQQISALTAQRNSLSNRINELSSVPLDPGQVITPATLQGSGPNLKNILPLAGLILGLIGGTVLALLRLKTDSRIRRPMDVEGLGLTIVGTVGWAAADEKARDVGSVPQLEEDIRKVRVAVLSLEQRRPLTMAIFAADRSSITPFSTLYLGASLARSGLETLIIDATTKGMGPGATLLGEDAGPGLSDVLTGDTALSSAIQPLAPLMSIVVPGETLARTTDLFVGDQMTGLLTWAKNNYDAILVASESIHKGDSQSLASVVDCTVIEVEEGVTTFNDLEQAVRSLELLPSTPLGALFLGSGVLEGSPQFLPPTTVNRRQLAPGPRGSITAPPPSIDQPPEEPYDRRPGEDTIHEADGPDVHPGHIDPDDGDTVRGEAGSRPTMFGADELAASYVSADPSSRPTSTRDSASTGRGATPTRAQRGAARRSSGHQAGS